MTDGLAWSQAPTLSPAAAARRAKRLRRRHAAERRFRFYGLAAIIVAAGMLCLLLATMAANGYSAFVQNEMQLEIYFDAADIDPQQSGNPSDWIKADYQGMVKGALRDLFPDVKKRKQKRLLYGLVSSGAGNELRKKVLADPSLIGATQKVWVKTSDDIDSLLKGRISRNIDGTATRLKMEQIAWIDAMAEAGAVRSGFNWTFFTAGDSREPEQAGIWGAIVGSFLTLTVTLLLSFPVGVLAAIYLQEFAPKNRLTDLIEVNINNLAAVPSIIFGLLGLAVILNFFGLPRSAPLVGGIVLALMTLPTIIIAARLSLQSVPPSIREAAMGMGASPLQVVMHHTLPLALPGIMTGTIIGMARALGETAPLLMIGMVAFIVDVPQSFTDPATALPVQIYLWADAPERAFAEKTNAAIMVLLVFLILMNGAAVWLRKRFERRW